MSTDAKTKLRGKLHGKLLEVLGEVDRPGDVCTSGDQPLTMPGLEVEGLVIGGSHSMDGGATEQPS